MTMRLAARNFDVARVIRFGSVGLASTLFYALLAWALTNGARFGAAASSVLAYALAGVFSYLAQKNLTFRSTAPHRVAAPRFIASCAFGGAISAAAPLLLTDRLRLPSMIAIGFTCVVVPFANYLVLDRLVFRAELQASAP